MSNFTGRDFFEQTSSLSDIGAKRKSITQNV